MQRGAATAQPGGQAPFAASDVNRAAALLAQAREIIGAHGSGPCLDLVLQQAFTAVDAAERLIAPSVQRRPAPVSVSAVRTFAARPQVVLDTANLVRQLCEQIAA